nr:MAG TPA: ABC transporter ATP-binding protein [Bacteriophage sp.]
MGRPTGSTERETQTARAVYVNYQIRVKGQSIMSYNQTARELDALDERSEEISERLDEIEEELEYAEQGTERVYELLDEKEELEQEREELEQRKSELTTDGFTRWDNGF